MRRLQVHLPEDLYREVKARHIKVSDLLKEAVRKEVLRQQRIEGIDRYIADLVAEVGEPSPEDETRAAALVDRLLRHGVGGKA